MHRSAVVRTAFAGSVAVTSLIAATHLILHGLSLSIAFFGEQPDNPQLGSQLFFAGLLVLAAGVLAAPHIAGVTHPWLRSALAVPAALAVGYLGRTTFVALGPAHIDRVMPFAMLCAGVAVLVAPVQPKN